MPNRIYYQSNRDVSLKTQWDYYENNKEAIKEQAKIKYHNLTGEEKDKRCEYAKNWYNNLSEHKKNEKGHMEKIDIIICSKKRSKN